MANRNRRRSGFGYSMSLTGPGTIFTIAFIALAIGMGVLLSRGVTPKNVLTDPGQTDGELEVEEDTSLNGQKGLQLKTLKFKECASTITVDLMLDRSGSMGDRTPSGVRKIDRLKEAVISFFQKANDDSVVGIQSFSTPVMPVPLLANDVPVSFYRDVKGILAAKVNALSPGGATPTHDALNFSYNILKDAVLDPRFKDRKFNFIFVSDGAPCPGFGCEQAGTDQDPRLYTPNPATLIKDLGVTVYALAIYDSNQSSNPQMAELMKSIASSPENYFAADSADDTKRLLSQISTRICNSTSSPTPTP